MAILIYIQRTLKSKTLNSKQQQQLHCDRNGQSDAKNAVHNKPNEKKKFEP